MSVAGRRAIPLERQVLKRFGHLLDLTASASRGAADRDFLSAPADGEPAPRVHYVFDTNVFQLFIKPFAYPAYAENFYAPLWNDRPGKRGYSVQAGLLASEYLFSDRLPGLLTDAPIYVTKYHYDELKVQLFDIRREQQKAADRAAASLQDVEKYLLEAAELGRLGEAAEYRRLRAKAPVELKGDVDAFVRGGGDEILAKRMIIACQVAASLAADRVLEPVQQMKRLYTDVLPRIRSLNQAWQVRDTADTADLGAMVHLWISNLQESYGDAANQGRVQYDARSIGLVHWISKYRLEPHERIVFVTGDAKLFDAYRNWYRNKDPGEPFILRSVNQYAPLINPHDMPSDYASPDESPSYDLFEKIRAAIDSPLITFRLKSQTGQDTINEGGREHLASFLMRNPAPESSHVVRFFTHGLKPEWWEQRAENFESLRDQWLKAERLAVSVSLPMLESRLTSRQVVLASVAAGTTTLEAAEAFSKHLRGVLDVITTEALRYDLPDAIRFVQERTRGQTSIRPRAPLSLNFEIPVRDGGATRMVSYRDLMAKVDEASQEIIDWLDPETNPALGDRHDVHFAVAAGLAVRGRLWRDAERYAENAIHAAERVNPRYAAETASAMLEYRYLVALARRFLLANERPADIYRLRQKLEAAVGELDGLEAIQAEHDCERRLRNVSERLATRLFFATWTVVDRQTDERPLIDAGREGASELKLAIADLREGWRLAGDRATDADAGAALVTLAVNGAAMAVVDHLLRLRHEAPAGFTSAELDVIEKRALAQIDGVDRFPPIVAVDLYAFLVLVRGREGYQPKLIEALKDPGLGDLAIDRALRDKLQAIVRGSGKPAASGGRPRVSARPAPPKRR